MDGSDLAAAETSGALASATRLSGEQEGPPSPLGNRPHLVAAGVIAVAAILTYANSFTGPFIFDDFHAIVRNPHVRSLLPITEAMDAPKESSVAGRPVVALSLAVNYAISGYQTWSYHVFNLIVHVLAALLLYGIVRRTLISARLKDRFGRDADVLALICAVIWVVHPLQTEAVTYIIQRAESMMGMFYLLTVYCAIRGFTSRVAPVWYGAAVAACAAGMGSKEVMVSAPVMVLLYDWVFVSRSPGKLLSRRWGFYALLAATWIVLVLLMLPGPRSKSAGFSFGQVGPLEYAKTQCTVIVHYIRLALLPSPLVLNYPRKTVESLGDYGLQAALLAVLAVGTIVALKYKPGVGFLGAWFFLILGPTSSFVPIADPIFEHRMYLSLAAIVVGTVLGVYALTQVIRAGYREAARTAALALAAAVILALGVTSHLRNRDYHSELNIWQDTVKKVPDSSFAWYNLAVALSQQRRHEEAIAKCDEAIRLKPDYAQAYCHRGGCYISLGRLDKALEDLNTAIKLDATNAAAFSNRGAAYKRKGQLDLAIADFTKAIELNPMDARYYNNRGLAYHGKRLYDLALADYDKALELRPGYVIAYKGRALAHLGKKDYERALEDLDKAIELNPRYPTAYRARAHVLGLMGREEEVIANWSQAVKYMRNWPEALTKLAWLLATSSNPQRRDGRRALYLASHACELTKNVSPVALDAMAAAQAELGQFDDAATTIQKACELAAASGRANLEEMKARLELYRTGRPYRQPVKPAR